MYKMLLLNYLAVSCLFFRILFPANVARADITQEIDSILIGIYEKGYQLGAQFKLNNSASLSVSTSIFMAGCSIVKNPLLIPS